MSLMLAHAGSALDASPTGAVAQTHVGADWSEALCVALDGDGRLLVGGTADFGTFDPAVGFTTAANFDWVLRRYTSAGVLDPTFGCGGEVRFDHDATGSGDDDELTDLVVQPDGKIVCAGISWRVSPAARETVVARFDSDGSLDRGFANFGVATLAQGGDATYFQQTKVALQSTGKVVVATSRVIGGLRQFTVMQLRANGNAGFATNNTIHAASKDCPCWAMLVQPDDKIVMAGATLVSGSHKEFFVCRWLSTGLADTGFGGAGADGNGVVVDFPEQLEATAFSLLHESATGKIVAVGNVAGDASNHTVFGLCRLSSAGVLDETFGTSGLSRIASSGVHDNDEAAKAVYLSTGKVLAAGDSIVTGGNYYTAGESGLAVRTSALGVLDSAYGSSGHAVPTAGTSNEVFYHACVDGSDGVYLAGHRDGAAATGAVAWVVKLSAAGAVDSSWGDPSSPATTTAPEVTTSAASSVGQTTATLNGTVDPNGRPTVYQFEYGLTTSYGVRTPAPNTSAGAGSSPAAVTASLTGLLSGFAYHWRLCAANDNGQVVYSADRTFTTTSGAVNTLVSDTFTDADGTSTLDHTPDVRNVSAFYVNFNSTGSIQSNRAQGAGNWQVAVDCGVTDATVQLGYRWNGSGTAYVAVLGRYLNTSNYWAAEWTGTTFRVYDRVAGGNTVRATTATPAIAANTTYVIKIVVSGTSVTATIDGGNSISYASMATLATNTRWGWDIDHSGDTVDDLLITSP